MRKYSVTITRNCRADGKILTAGQEWVYDADNAHDVRVLRDLVAANRVVPTEEARAIVAPEGTELDGVRPSKTKK